MKEFSWPIRVYYEDTDAGGLVFHANYLKFLERARTEMLRSRGFEQDRLIAEENLIFVIRSLSIDYLKPARFNEQIDVGSKIIENTKTSLIFEQSITRQEDVLCNAKIRVVCLNAQSMKPKVIPSAILEQLI